MKILISSLSWYLVGSKSIMSVVISISCILQYCHVCVNHEDDIHGIIVSGMPNNCPLNPTSKQKASIFACRRCPMGSSFCHPNLSSVSMCIINCSVNELGISRLWWLCGLWATAHGKCQLMPMDSKALISTGCNIAEH